MIRLFRKNKGTMLLLGILGVIIVFSVIELYTESFGVNKKTEDVRKGFLILLPEEDITSLALEDDTIWAAGRDGVYRIDRNKYTVLEKIVFQKNVIYVKALCVDKNGFLWIGYDGGLILYTKNKIQYFDTENGLPDNRVSAVFEDAKGRILVGTWGGLGIFDGVNWQYIKKSDGLASDMVNVIMEDHEGGLWLGAYLSPDGAVSILKDNKWQYFSIKNGLPNNNITSIYEESPGEVWVGTGFYDEGGTVKLVNINNLWVKKSELTKSDGLAGYKVRSLFKDSIGNMWFGSEYDGGALFNNGKSIIINKEDGLSDNEIKAILQDPDKNIWLGTHRGVTILDYDELKKLK